MYDFYTAILLFLFIDLISGSSPGDSVLSTVCIYKIRGSLEVDSASGF